MDYEQLKHYGNNRDGFIQKCGIEITEVSKGYCKGRVPLDTSHENPMGSIHGGCIFTLADTIGGTAAISHGFNVVTINSEIHYLNPAVNTSYIYAEAIEIKYGKQISVYEVDITDDEGTLIATTHISFFNTRKKIGE